MSETYFVKVPKKEKFTVLDNTCIQDKTLSWKSKGVHTYLMSLPEDWKIFITEIVNHSRDGKAALYSAIQELEKHGYLKKIQNRRENGCFDNTIYYVFEKPYEKNYNSPLTDFPHTDNPDTDKPDTDNRTLQNTNIQNTNIQKTKLTNSNQPVSESVFVTAIKCLFDGEYGFDKNFEGDVYELLKKSEIEHSFLESYLNYVFERTKLGNPIKSFEGLYRKLALSSSIIRDFKLSNNYKTENDDSEYNPYEHVTVCPICGTVFDSYEFYCPKCSLSVDAIKEHDVQEITIRTKLYQMSEQERAKFDSEYQSFVEKKGRGFLTPNEQIKFYRDYGILQ